jgi:hypothetical protein
MSPLAIQDPESAESPTSTTGLDQGVIEEARRRQHRRRTSGTIGAVLAAAVGAVLLTQRAAHTPRPSPPPATHSAHHIPIARSAAVLAREPGMGVACQVPNSIACDRVGLAVWLRRPAIAVSATIAGSALNLNDPAWSGSLRNGRRTMFAGFLQPAGLLDGALKVRPDRGRYYWIGSHEVGARVSIVVDYGGGLEVETTTMVGLHAGWG